MGKQGLLAAKALGDLFSILLDSGYQVIGPRVRDGSIVYEPVSGLKDLPLNLIDEQQPGTYRLKKKRGAGYFSFTLGPHAWKRYLFPPMTRLWTAARGKDGFTIKPETDAPRQAFIGVRACELKAMKIQDKVFMEGENISADYLARREEVFIVAVNCRRAAETCFCVSMGAGPKVEDGFDLALTELTDKGRHDFLVEAGSKLGEKMLAKLPSQPPNKTDQAAAEKAITKVAKSMRRKIPKDARKIMLDNLQSNRWDDIAARCTACGNCTMVCPTCFCSTVRDQTSLDGKTAERTRQWDSCFTLDFSYIHGGSIRRSTGARYRQWMTHKLAHWHDQFNTSGCVGCGRCITWCPVGIDITKEAKAFKK